MAEALRDKNQVTTLLAVSSVDGITPVVLWADPVTHRLLVDETADFIESITDTASVNLIMTGTALSAEVLPSGVDHNSLANLTTGDPHTQYLLESGSISSITTRDHDLLTGLIDDDHTQYALLAGRSSGQTLIGGTGTTDDLILRSTSGAGVL